MEYRQFGKTDLRVSAIGFGCWEIGGTYGRIDESRFQRAVRQAIDDGITCFDTAEAYGMGVSEEAVGRALGARRRDVSIVTKFGVGYEENAEPARQQPPAGHGVDREEPQTAANRLRRCVHGALARPRDAPRRDDGCPRRHRAPGQGALYRRLE